MSNETEGEGAGPVAEVERKAIAKRLWIDANGNEVETVEDATGVSYEFIGRTKNNVTVPADGKSFSIQFRDMSPKMKDMLAGFGAHTLMGNITNTWLGEKGEKSPRACDAVSDRFDLLQSGTWVDRTREGFKIDIPTLAQAWINVVIAAGKTAKDPLAVETKLTDTPELVKQLRRDPKVTAEYARLRGAAVIDASSLMDELSV